MSTLGPVNYFKPVLLSAGIHGLVLLGGLSLLYQNAEFGLAPGGGQVGAKLVTWDEVSEITNFKPQPVPLAPAPDQFVIPKKEKSAPVKEQPRGNAAVEGSAGQGEGYGNYTSQPRYFRNPMPPYPKSLRGQGIEGQVLLEVSLDSKGRVKSVQIVQSSGYPEFDNSALNTIQQRWRFRPARIGSLKVESKVRVPVVFEIQK